MNSVDKRCTEWSNRTFNITSKENIYTNFNPFHSANKYLRITRQFVTSLQNAPPPPPPHTHTQTQNSILHYKVSFSQFCSAASRFRPTCHWRKVHRITPKWPWTQQVQWYPYMCNCVSKFLISLCWTLQFAVFELQVIFRMYTAWPHIRIALSEDYTRSNEPHMGYWRPMSQISVLFALQFSGFREVCRLTQDDLQRCKVKDTRYMYINVLGSQTSLWFALQSVIAVFILAGQFWDKCSIITSNWPWAQLGKKVHHTHISLGPKFSPFHSTANCFRLGPALSPGSLKLSQYHPQVSLTD